MEWDFYKKHIRHKILEGRDDKPDAKKIFDIVL